MCFMCSETSVPKPTRSVDGSAPEALTEALLPPEPDEVRGEEAALEAMEAFHKEDAAALAKEYDGLVSAAEDYDTTASIFQQLDVFMSDAERQFVGLPVIGNFQGTLDVDQLVADTR